MDIVQGRGIPLTSSSGELLLMLHPKQWITGN